jgi:exodeoxyribonuclease V alpha subunit
MSNDLALLPKQLFPSASPRLLTLHAAVASEIDPIDLYTIRDLTELSNRPHDEDLHALLLLMLLAMDEGSACIEFSQENLCRRLGDFIPAPQAAAWAAGIVTTTNRCPDLIGESAEDGKPLVFHRRDGRTYCYFQRYFKAERALEQGLHSHLAAIGRSAPPSGWETWIAEVDRCHATGQRSLPKLSPLQRAAVERALRQNLLIVSGGPGTGKTTIILAILRCLLRCGLAPERIALTASTGRAAQRMTETVLRGRDCLPLPAESSAAEDVLSLLAGKTIHHLLGYHPVRGTFRHGPRNPLPVDAVIIDEASMIGLALMAQLLHAVPPGAKLVLLGDKDQLPSVEAGAVLADLVPAPAAREPDPCPMPLFDRVDGPGLHAVSEACDLTDIVVVLDQNHRSDAKIQQIAQGINQQRLTILDDIQPFFLKRATGTLERGKDGAASSFAQSEEQGGCWLLEEAHHGLEAWQHILRLWVQRRYLDGAAGSKSYCELVAGCELDERDASLVERAPLLEGVFRLLESARILTLVREGPWGCVGINRFAARVMQPAFPALRSFFPGMPIVIMRNDPVRQLFNGDVGVVIAGRDRALHAVFRRSGGFASFPVQSLPLHEPAFALTVHKSQGAEYDHVLLALPSEGARRLLTKEMIYTAVTRARHTVVIAGAREMLGLAVQRRSARESGLGVRVVRKP